MVQVNSLPATVPQGDYRSRPFQWEGYFLTGAIQNYWCMDNNELTGCYSTFIVCKLFPDNVLCNCPPMEREDQSIPYVPSPSSTCWVVFFSSSNLQFFFFSSTFKGLSVSPLFSCWTRNDNKPVLCWVTSKHILQIGRKGACFSLPNGECY